MLLNRLITLMPVGLLFLVATNAIAQPVEMIHRWQFDPDINVRWIQDFGSIRRAVNLEPFDSQNLRKRVVTAQSTSLQSRFGITNQEEAYKKALDQLANQPTKNDLARLALVSAAANTASDRGDVESIWDLVADDPVVHSAVESKLIQVNSSAALELWRARLAAGQSTAGAFRFSDLLTALDGIATVGGPEDRAALEVLLMKDGTALPIQIAAAKAMGSVVDSGLADLALNIMDSKREQSDLLAANLLAQHPSAEAATLLDRIMRGNNASAQIIAYKTVTANDPPRARELAEELILHPDNNLRLAAVMVLNDYDDAASLNIQAMGMSDLAPAVRNQVRGNLREKAANPELRTHVDNIITQQLANEKWQGVEQALTLIVELQEHERAPGLVSLLDHPKQEVHVRAGWALQNLELTNATLDGIFQRCQVTTQKLADFEYCSFAEVAMTAFLFEAIGRHAFEPATEMLKLYVPEDNQKMMPLTRASAIYALGTILKDTGDQHDKLTQDIAVRMLDTALPDPEEEIVMYTCAIALGRIKNPASVPELEGIEISEDGLPLHNVRRWALQQFE